MVAAAVRTIFAQPDAIHVRAQLDEVACMLTGQFPDVATMLTDSAEDILAFSAFPQAHWRKIWSTNPLVVLDIARVYFRSANHIMFHDPLAAPSS